MEVMADRNWDYLLSLLPADWEDSAKKLGAARRLRGVSSVSHLHTSLPKRDAASSRAWVYAKLLIALLTEKMQRHAASLSPWGGRWLEQDPPPEPLA